MSKRTIIVTVIVFAFLLWGFGWPLLTIYLNLNTAARVQESLLVLLREKYPDLVFEKGGVGFTGPSAGIRVVGPIDSAIQLEIQRFLEAEKANRKFEVEIFLYFIPDEKEPVKI